MQLKLLRLFLGFAAIAWGVSLVGVFLSWRGASEALQGLGANPISYDPMLDYWLRMASGAFGLVGVWYFILMLQPRKFAAAIPWFGGLMLVEGVVLLVHGVRLRLGPFPFYGDVAACFVCGTAIVYFSKYAYARPGWNQTNCSRTSTEEIYGLRMCPFALAADVGYLFKVMIFALKLSMAVGFGLVILALLWLDFFICVIVCLSWHAVFMRSIGGCLNRILQITSCITTLTMSC
jgi:hypothetical protein